MDDEIIDDDIVHRISTKHESEVQVEKKNEDNDNFVEFKVKVKAYCQSNFRSYF